MSLIRIIRVSEWFLNLFYEFSLYPPKSHSAPGVSIAYGGASNSNFITGAKGSGGADGKPFITVRLFEIDSHCNGIPVVSNAADLILGPTFEIINPSPG